MIEFPCDRCDRTLSADDASAGSKMTCPDCGDVNRVPAGAGAGGGGSGEPLDRAARAGLPPDAGPEQEVIRVSPSLWRGHPFATTFVLVLPVAAGVLGTVFGTPALGGVLLASVGAPVLLGLLVAWMKVHVAVTLVITNKRTVERRGLFSKSVDEVMHDHVRNITVDQTFADRVFDVGRIGISSAGQAGVEIDVRDVPKPVRVKEVIDLYRPM